MRNILLLTALLTVNLSSMTRAQENQQPSWASDPFVEKYSAEEFKSSAGDVLKYRSFAPKLSGDKKVPLLIFLHGAGERGSDNVSQLKHGAREFVSYEFQSQHPCYVIAPQCPIDNKWADVDWSKPTVTQPSDASNELLALHELIAQLIKEAAVDADRIYLTGLSMGGYGTWDAIARYPDLFAAAVPICGGADLATASGVKDIPIWCFHGDADPVVNVSLSRDMINAIKAAGGSPKYTEYPGVQHDSWTQTYSTPELFTWMFAQHR